MASNNNTIVISFSIALFLLLILLLLITYNSKCQMDNVETFLGDPVSNIAREQQEMQNINSVATVAQNDPKFSVKNQIGSESEFYEDNVLASDPSGNSYDALVDDEDEKPQQQLIDDEDEEEFGGITQGTLATEATTNCFPKDRLTSNDLLPQGANSKWATVNPSGAGDITDQNFLTAGYHIGINTVGQSLRNANLQLRHEPPNPQSPVSPWGISTIEPDSRMNGLLDIGAAPTSE